MDTLAARVKAARKFRGMTQAQLAKASGAGQSDISKIERGASERTIHILALSVALQCDPVWLDTGDGNPPWAGAGEISGTNRYKLQIPVANAVPSSAPYLDRRYPLLSSVQAGSWGAVDVPASEIEDYVICPVDLGEDGFCLQVDGDSMTTTDGPFSFPHGMNVCFKTGEDVRHKDFVCVVREGEANAIFKQLLHIDGQYFLHSLNPVWPTKFIPMQRGDRITGKLRYAGWQF